jgi:hypothetical protein
MSEGRAHRGAPFGGGGTVGGGPPTGTDTPTARYMLSAKNAHDMQPAQGTSPRRISASLIVRP